MRQTALSIVFVLIAFTGFAQLVPHAYNFNVENFPSLFGGHMEYNRLLRHHMVYPQEELEQGIGGRVKIYFIVTKEGKTRRAQVTESVSPAIDYEAMRLLSLIEWIPSSQWDPHLKVSEPVNAEWSFTVKFSPRKYKRWVKKRNAEVVPFKRLAVDTSFDILEVIDTVPVFNIPGKTFVEFVKENYEYPKLAALQDIKGTMRVTFVVEPDGYCTNIRIKEGIAGGCNEEMIRVIGLTRWVPGIKNGKYVRYRYPFTMDLNLNNTYKDNSNGSQRGWGQ